METEPLLETSSAKGVQAVKKSERLVKELGAYLPAQSRRSAIGQSFQTWARVSNAGFRSRRGHVHTEHVSSFSRSRLGFRESIHVSPRRPLESYGAGAHEATGMVWENKNRGGEAELSESTSRRGWQEPPWGDWGCSCLGWRRGCSSFDAQSRCKWWRMMP